MEGTGISLDDEDMKPDKDWESKGRYATFNQTPFVKSALEESNKALA